MDPRIHQAVGWIYFGPAWLSLFPINGIIGFMLTPGAGVAAGFWFLTRLPREVMLLFMGRSAAGTVLFAAGILFTALVLLTAYKRRVLPTVVLAVVLVYLMTFLRDFVRTGYLSPVFSPDQLKVAPQFGPMVLFAVALVAGISVLAWMILKAKEAVSVSREG
jgi:ABC-type thiamin/hydroxymethylpyrimidine transport system permease subunit